MAIYKVIQDIESEDKLLGPLTLRQFIYACIAAVCLFLCYYVIAHHAGFMVVVFFPPAIFTGFFAFPWGRDQPTEVWALAKIRFILKPHRRIWDQSGIKELVTITAPKKVEINYTNGLSQTEVRSRLKALASTIDSRGWAVKNVNVNLTTQYGQNVVSSDRLVDSTSLPQEVQSNLDISAADDMLDEINSPIARQFNQMITKSSQDHRQQIVQQLQQAQAPQSPKPVNTNTSKAVDTQAPNNYWFMDQPQPGATKPGYVTFNPSVVGPGTAADDMVPSETPEEKALAQKIKANRNKPEPAYSHLRTLQPLSSQPKPKPIPTTPKPAPAPNPALYQLAQNDDLNIATLAREAKKEAKADDGEVVITLH